VVGKAKMNLGGSGGPYAEDIVVVEADSLTGGLSIIRLAALQDDTTIHSHYVEGMAQGGAPQGVGLAPGEEYCMRAAGRMLDTGFLGYRMPDNPDLPITPVEVLKALEEDRRGKTRS